MQIGHLTVADLAVWFDKPHATMYSWAFYEREPRSIHRREITLRLELLEKAIRQSEGGQIVPYETSARERTALVRKCFDAVSKRVPVRRSAS